MKPSSQPPGFATIVREFFCDWLLNQQNVSPHTVASYRDTFRLLLRFMENKRQRPAAAVTLADLDAPAILAFLDDLESDRKNVVRTRNARLAAIRAFARHAAARDPTSLPSLQRVLAIPQKRFDRPLLGYLTRAEVEAVLNAPDPAARSGRRDRAMFTLMYNTGARVSEAIDLCCGDVHLGPTAYVHIHGKGRKERSVPLWKATADVLKQWLVEISHHDKSPLFPNRHGNPLTRSGVEDRLQRAVSAATARCSSLPKIKVSPHTLRHNGHAPASVRCRRDGHRLVAGTPKYGDDPSVRRSRSGDEAARARPHRRAVPTETPPHEAWRTAGLPRSTVTGLCGVASPAEA